MCLTIKFTYENCNISIVMPWWISRNVVLVAYFQAIHFPACAMNSKQFQLWKKIGKRLRVTSGEEVNLEEAFRYTVTTVPLSLAFPDSTLRQNPKHHFRIYPTDVRKGCELTPPNKPRWIIDTMSVMKAIKVKETYKECFSLHCSRRQM